MKYRYCLFILFALLTVSCRREARTVRVAGPDGTQPIELVLRGSAPAVTRSMTVADNGVAGFTVTRTPMDGAATRAFSPVTADNCSELFVTLFKDGEPEYINHLFEKGEDGVFTGGLYWPATSAGYEVIVSNVRVDVGSSPQEYENYIHADGTEDIIVGSATASWGEPVDVSLHHIYGVVGSLSIETPLGTSARLVSAELTSPVAGSWEIFHTSWDSNEPAQVLPLAEGDNGLFCCQGRRRLKVAYELYDGSHTQTVEAEHFVTIKPGCINNITVNVGSCFEYDIRILPPDETILFGRKCFMYAYLNTWYVPASGEGRVLVAGEDITQREGLEWTQSPEGIVENVPDDDVEDYDLKGVSPGTATVSARYGAAEGSTSLTVLDYETGIEVSDLEVTIDCTDDNENVSPAGAELSFLVNMNFQYRVLYASGRTSGWFSYGDGPIDYERFYSSFGLSLIPYLSGADPVEGFAVKGTDGDFTVIVQPNTETDRAHTATAGIRMSLKGESVTDEMDIVQHRDYLASTEYRNLMVSILSDGQSSITESADAHSVPYAISTSVEVRRTMASGRVIGWTREALDLEDVRIDLSVQPEGGFITLVPGEDRLELASNIADGYVSPRQGSLTVYATFRDPTTNVNLEASAKLSILQVAGGISHVDYRNMQISEVTCVPEFPAVGGTDVPVTVHGSYDERPVSNSTAPAENDWITGVSFDEKPAALYIVQNGSRHLPGEDDWISYDAEKGTMTVKPNYTGGERSLTLRAKAERKDTNRCNCQDAPQPDGWVASAEHDFTITQKPTTLLDVKFRFRSPSHPWDGSTQDPAVLAYDDCVFELYQITTEHGTSTITAETDPGKREVWEAIDYRMENFILYFNGNKDSESLPDNGGMVMSPAMNTFAKERAVTWNDVRTALRSNHSISYPELQYLRYTMEEVEMYGNTINSSYSQWTLYYDCDVTIRFGNATFHKHLGEKLNNGNPVRIDKMEIIEPSIIITPIGPEQDEEDENHYRTKLLNSFSIHLFGEYKARYRLCLKVAGKYVTLCDRTDWESVRYTNIGNRVIDWYYPEGPFTFSQGSEPFTIEARRNDRYYSTEYYEQSFYATFRQGNAYLGGSVTFVGED